MLTINSEQRSQNRPSKKGLTPEKEIYWLKNLPNLSKGWGAPQLFTAPAAGERKPV
jgi:hypothetical protein